jgi:hypothetical protein
LPPGGVLPQMMHSWLILPAKGSPNTIRSTKLYMDLCIHHQTQKITRVSKIYTTVKMNAIITERSEARMCIEKHTTYNSFCRG